MAKRKPAHAYDTGKDEDRRLTRFLRAAGMPLTRRYSQGEIDALEQMTPEQRGRMKLNREHMPAGVSVGYSGPSFEQTRIQTKDGGAPVTKAVRVSPLPRSLWWLEASRLSAVEMYQVCFEGAMPSESVSIQPRMDGGALSGDPYDEKAMSKWSKARKQMSRMEARTLETFLRAPDDALVGTHQVFSLNSAADKLYEYFEYHGDI